MARYAPNQGQRFAGWALPLTLTVIAVFLLSAAGGVGAQGVTAIYSTAPFDPEMESMPLGGLTFKGEEGDFHLAVVWDQERSPFGFSLWRVALKADANFLPRSLGPRLLVRTVDDRDEVGLAYLSPEPGHAYELTIAYDVASATMGLALSDRETGSLLLHGSYPLQPFPGDVEPYQPGAADTLALDSVVDAYTPVGITWYLAEPSTSDDRLVAVARISKQRDAFVQVICPDSGLTDTLALAYRTDNQWVPWVELGACSGEQAYQVPVETLPTRDVDITLMYPTSNGTRPIGRARTYQVVAGVVTLTSSVPYWETGVLRGALTARADGQVAGRLRVEAEVDKFIDGNWQPASTITLHDAPVQLDPEGISLPLTFEGIAPSESVRIRLNSEIDLEEAWLLVGDAREYEVPSQVNEWMTLPHIDLAQDKHRMVIVDRTDGGYRGHTDTVLLEGNTILAVYALGHGGATALQRSDDGGLTWSGRLPVPEDWERTSDVPTIHKLVDPNGVERLLVFQTFGIRGISNEQRQSISEDGGKTWSPFVANRLWSPVSPNTVVPISGGRYLTVFQLDGRIEQSISHDGGLTWERQKTIAVYPGARLTEPAVLRSPDGKQLAVLIRENTRKFNSMLIVSDDEGATWTTPVELPAALTGDRHKPVYTHDGRLVVVFRDMAHDSPTHGDFVAWVGTFDDLINLREGQYRVRLLDNPGPPRDTGYAGLEVLPDGTLVATTYVPLAAGERPSIVSVRFHPDELDKLAAYAD